MLYHVYKIARRPGALEQSVQGKMWEELRSGKYPQTGACKAQRPSQGLSFALHDMGHWCGVFE